MTDRELLELAAKAAGYRKYYPEYMGRKSFVTIEERFHNDDWRKSGTSITTMDWNPLEDDGDALRLAVKLRLLIESPFNQMGTLSRPLVRSQERARGVSCNEGDQVIQDPYAATRRAIVRAAAEIGGGMP